MAQTCLASGDCQRVGTKSSSYPLTSKLFSRRLHHLKGPQCKQYAKPFYFILQLLQEHSFFKLVLRYFNSVGRFLIFLIFMKVWLMKYSLSRLELKECSSFSDVCLSQSFSFFLIGSHSSLRQTQYHL